MGDPVKIDAETNVIHVFEKWYQHYIDVCSELSYKNGCLQQVNKEKSILTETILRLQTDRSNRQEIITQCQQVLHQLDALMGKNDHLMRELDEKEQEMHRAEQQFKDNIKALEKAHTRDLEELRDRLTENHEAEVYQLNATIHELEEEQVNLQESLQSQRRKADTELATLTLDYESKIARIQRKKEEDAQQQRMARNVHVFKGKMQQMKEQYEAEIADLKFQLYEMRRRDAWQRDRGPSKSLNDWAPTKQPGKHNKLSLSCRK